MATNKTQIKLTSESKRLLKTISKSGDLDLRPSFKTIGIGYRKEVKSIFEKQQPRNTGLRWAALSPQYASWKTKHFPGRPLLVREGTLKESMIRKAATGNITLISKSASTFGSIIPYGKFHDDGTSKMPKRNFSEPSERRFNIWRLQLERDITRQFEMNGIEVKGAIFQ